jgi:hypothetical protein
VYTYRISQPDRLVHIEARGEANLTGSQQILLTVMKDEHFLPEYDFLVDVRAMTSDPPTSDLEAFADFLGTLKALRGRFVVVAAAGLQFGLARVMCALTEVRHVQMTVFRDEISAKAWLKSDRA